MIVNKHIDLNVYKEGADLLNKDELQAGEGCSSIMAGGGENMRSLCCRPSNTSTSEEKARCGDGSKENLSKLISDTDFNEWVGECRMLCPYFLMIG
jgi:hypothetical protein